MRARTAPITAAALAVAALALTACGGSGGGGDGDATISPSAAPGTTASPTPAKAASAAPLKLDPAVKLPPGIEVAFDFGLPKDATRAAALTGAADYIQAIDHAVAGQDRNDPALRGYATAGALSYAQKYVQANIDAKQTLSGTDTYFRPLFPAGGSRSPVEITLCDDQSKIYSKDIATGKVHVTGASDRNYVSYDLVMVKLPAAQAIWQATAVTVKERALQCKE